MATKVEGGHDAVPAKQQARHVVVGRYDKPPVLSLLPVLQSSSSSPTCLPFLSFLCVFASLPVLASLPSVPACLLPSRIAMRTVGDGGAHRHAARCPLLPASVCAPSAAPSVLPSVPSSCLCAHPHSSLDSAAGAWDWGCF